MRTTIDDEDDVGSFPSPRREKVSSGKVIHRLAHFQARRGYRLHDFSSGQGEGVQLESTMDDLRESMFSVEDAGSQGGEFIGNLYKEATQQLRQLNQPTEDSSTEFDVERPEHSSDAPVAPPRWRALGPYRIPGGQTYGSGRVDVSGRVSAVAIDPNNPNHILCGAAAGGIWESYNGGMRWLPRGDQLPTLTVGAVAFDPSNTSIVYLGTGEGDFYSALGAGLYRSINGGQNWLLQSTNPTSRFVGEGFHALLVDPKDSGRLFAGTTSGLYISTDQGVTWTKKKNNRTWGISIGRTSVNSTELLAGCSDGLFQSLDNGDSWSEVPLSGTSGDWVRIDVDHVRSSGSVAYAFGVNGASAHLFRRSSRNTWQRISLPTDLAIGQAWYDWFVGASPDRENEIYLGAINVHRGNLRGSTWQWENIAARGADDSIHPDQHAIAFHPNDSAVVYIGNDGGLYRSDDRGESWNSLNNGLAITEFEYIAQDPGSTQWLMGGTQDNGTNSYTGSSVWTHIADGDGGDCAVNDETPDTIFQSYFRMGFSRSTDRGRNWTWLPNASRDPNNYRQLFYPPLEGKGSTVAQAGESVFVSRENGNNIMEIDLPGRPTASAMHMPTTSELWVGTTEGDLFRIRWNGTSWGTPTQINSPRSSWISDIFVVASNSQELWVTSSRINGGRIFHTTDGGGTWIDRSNGLPSLPINAIVGHDTNRNRLWVAADVGVFQTFNGGRTWQPFALDLPNCLIVDLIYQKHARLLRAGTRNRGVWEIAVNGDLHKPICGVQITGAVPANSTRRWFTFNWPATWNVIWTVMPTTVRRGARQLSWDTQVERANSEFVTYWISVTNHTSQAVSFEGRYCILGFR